MTECLLAGELGLTNVNRLPPVQSCCAQTTVLGWCPANIGWTTERLCFASLFVITYILYLSQDWEKRIKMQCMVCVWKKASSLAHTRPPDIFLSQIELFKGAGCHHSHHRCWDTNKATTSSRDRARWPDGRRRALHTRQIVRQILVGRTPVDQPHHIQLS